MATCDSCGFVVFCCKDNWLVTLYILHVQFLPNEVRFSGELTPI